MQTQRPLFAILAVLALASSSCFVRKRVVTLPGHNPGTPLLTATKSQLIEQIHRLSDPLQSFTMRANISPSAGSLYEGEIKDYATLGGYVLFQKPDSIRIVGLDPMVSSTVFDMASVGNTFRLHIPSQNRFMEGDNDAMPTGDKQWKNLRPVAFLTSLIIQPPDPQLDITLLEEDTNERESDYILLMIRRAPNEPWLARTLHFDRRNLEIVRQKTFDSLGGVLSDTNYSGWRIHDGLPFPSVIDIKRPQDHYETVLNVISMKINTSDVTPEKFILIQPKGTELERFK
jgi:hypothetical protein